MGETERFGVPEGLVSSSEYRQLFKDVASPAEVEEYGQSYADEINAILKEMGV